MNFTKAHELLEQLEQTYRATAEQPGSVRLELWDPCFALGEALIYKNWRPAEAIEMTVKGLEALGFINRHRKPT